MGHTHFGSALALLVLSQFWMRSIAQGSNLTLSIEEGLPAKTIVGDISAALSGPTSSGFFISESRDSYVFKDLEINADTGIICTAIVLDREIRDKYEFVAATLTGEVIKVTIEVNDVNDNSPIFTSDTIDLEISELSPPGTRFELEGAKDQDEGEFGTQGYRITEAEMRGLFQVEYRNGSDNPFNLDLWLTSKLDRESRDSYSLTIEAFDGGVPARTGVLLVNVHVLDENDHPPVFNQSEYHASVSEDAALNSTVCRVHATDRDLGRNGLITYEINRRQSDSGQMFSVDGRTGDIYVNRPLDFEEQSFHELIVTARDHGAQPEVSSAFVGVKVLNVNDNAPTLDILFLSEAGDAAVSEGAAVGEYVARVLVSDGEADLRSVSLTLDGGEGRFALKQTDHFLFALCVAGPLDREEQDRYELTLRATDRAGPSLSTEVTFDLTVTDVNDCPPLFESDAYAVRLAEDALPGTSVVQVRARDADEGPNAAVRYTLLGPAGPRPQQDPLPFTIDPTSGVISTRGRLDREKEAEVRLLVEAQDGGGERALSSTATVTLEIADVNDNEPVFQQQLYNVSVPEHSQIGACFLQVVATDADGPNFASLRYSLSDGLDRRDLHPLFHIQPDSGEVCVSQDIDRDAGQTAHDILVKAVDQGGLSALTYVHIEVEDLNDNAPVFNPERYATSISSHAPPDTEVLTAIATDPDSGPYGRVTYELLPSDLSDLFTLDQDTGTLYLRSSVDHLGGASVQLSLGARDGGGLPSTTPAGLTVNVVGSAQAPAVFQRSRYSFSVAEDTPPGTSVGTVTAVRPGSSPEPVSYRISSGDPQGWFSVDPDSGLISTRRPLDHETQPYALLVLQSTTGSASSSSSVLFSSTQVNISVADVNDHTPIFPSERDSLTLSRHTPPGTVVFIAHARDADSGANGRVRYHLSDPQADPGGEEGPTFVIDPDRGTVRLNRSLRSGGRQTHRLDVVARDEGRPTLSARLTLEVRVDQAAPEEDALAFETLAYQVEIGEGYRTDSRVIQVKAHLGDRGAHPSAAIAYSLEPERGFPAPPFRVHPSTGWLYLYRSLDYEKEPGYRFRVVATAGDTVPGGNETRITTSASAVVRVLDINDNAPVFGSEVYYFTVTEASAPQGLVGAVQASDRDSRKNAELSYMLLSDGKFFRINPKTGEIMNWVALDREQHSQHTLKVMVCDHGQPRLNATATVHISVSDVNDNAPRFTHLPATKELSVQMWAGLTPGSLVTPMFAKDPDAGENATVTFCLGTEADRLGLFAIDPRSGDITLKAASLQPIETQYNLEVIARDGGLESLEEVAIVHVHVHGGSADSDGSQRQIVRRLHVREDAQPAAIVGSAAVPGAVRFHYSIAEGDGGVHFGVDPSSGDVYIARRLDYEAATQYLLVVRAQEADPLQGPPGLNVSVLVSVSVGDANDHTPWFPDDLVTLGLSEDVAVGTLAFAFHAKDADGSLANSELRYSLRHRPPESDPDPDAPFPLAIDPRTGRLTVVAPLDRETTPRLAFTVTASDRAGPEADRKQAYVTAQVFLLDVNDNRPVLLSPAGVRVSEDTETGALLHHVVAVDGDLGENGRVSYSIVDGDDLGVFRLEENTGLLYLASSLDREVMASYRLTIWAGDGGVPGLSSTQTLTVLVEDVNDQTPAFQQEVYEACVPENRPPGEPVVRVTATDGDSGMNAEVQYSLLPGPSYDLFSIHPLTGQVTTGAQLDREQQQQFTLRVLARDGGSPALSATSTVVCSVLDENDHPPRFMQSSFQVSLPENLPPGVLHTGQASDPDLGENSTIHYSIDVGEGDRGGRFTIHPLTGAVSSTEVLDREECEVYTLTLRATDGGPRPLSSTTQLHVRLLDENDNGPSFSRTHYHAVVAEGAAAGTAVLQLAASDPDQGPNGEVTYSLEEDGSQGAFAVDGSTGLIRTTRPLDREIRAQYTLRALATDGCAAGPQSAEVTVTVEVEDVNDNAPACARDPVSAQVSATRTWSPGQVLATVTATDLDQGENGTLQYSLAEGGDGLFALDRISGEIRLTRPLRAGFPGRRLHVLVEDRGQPALTSTCLVFVHLRGDQDGLLFTRKVYNATVRENSRAGTFVAKIEAVDQANRGLRIEYSIFSGNEREVFAINGNTGEITVRKPEGLDFEEGRQAQLVVLANGGLETAHSRVAVVLKDVNDNAPLFDFSYYRTAVWEGQLLNTYIMQVFASDADSGVNGQIEYSIVSGNQNNAFLLDPARGILATNVVLDREITPLYKLVVRATDRGSPALSGNTTIRVQVVDVNDNSPAFPPMRPVVISENLPVGYVVTQVTAVDVDLGSTISYRFTGGLTSGCFAIDRYTGLVTLTRALDYEERTAHVLAVLASDSLHETAGELVVQVMDVNDNAPVFDRTSYQVEASEEAPANALILTVVAKDSDSGLNGKVSYRLLNPPLLGFTIHPDNGSVFTNKPLKDIPHSSPIQLLVEARDGGDPARSSVTSVDLVVPETNSHAPAFDQDTYTVSAPEDTLLGATLITLSAEDADRAPENTHLHFDIATGDEESRFFLEVRAVASGERPGVVARLVLRGPLDRETRGSYRLVVTATDRGTPPLSGSAVVVVTVTDVNDNTPSFANTEYHAQVSEGSPAGTSLVRVSAQDPDLGVNGLVRYEVVSGNAKGHLRLDPDSGLLSVAAPLDHEEDSRYTLTVRASDGGVSPDRKVAFAVVYVSVLDENDNAPYFMFPSVNCSVAENLPAFSPVCSVLATDRDSGAFGQLTYSILSSCFTDYGSGSPERREAFGVDPLTGDIHTRQTLDYELEREFCLVLEARDRGGKAATLRAVVSVAGVDEFSPVFTQRRYSFRLAEDARPGQTVGRVQALDSDGGADGVVEYSLAEPSPFFSVDKTLGSITVSAPVYRQGGAAAAARDTVQMMVSARSPRPDSRSATCAVSIDISGSAVALMGVPLDAHAASLTVSLLTFLLFLAVFVGLVLRYRIREAAGKKAAGGAAAARLDPDSRDLCLPDEHLQHNISLQELIRPDSASQEHHTSNACGHSDSSGRGSAEGETAEDQEIKWINTFPRRKPPASLYSVGDSQDPEGDADEGRLACISAGLATALASAESLHHFREEGGGEGLLQTGSGVGDPEDAVMIRGHLPLSEEHRAPAVGSLSSLACPEDRVLGDHGWDPLSDWEPRFHHLASVFADIGMLRDEDLQGGAEDMAATDACCLMPPPPPLITGVAQPGIRAVPGRRAATLSRRPSYPRYSYSPLARNTGLTPCAMTPSFSPSLSLLTMRTPNASPVVSETGLGGVRMHSGPQTASLLEAEVQV